jgi:hypothetical protein
MTSHATSLDSDDNNNDEDDDNKILHFDLCESAAAAMFNNGNHVAQQQIAAHAPQVPKKQDRGTTWQMPHVQILHSTPRKIGRYILPRFPHGLQVLSRIGGAC